MKIYLLQLVILMSLSLNLQAQNLSGTIRGKVTCHGKGLQGVVVTDGIDCVLTNKSANMCLLLKGMPGLFTCPCLPVISRKQKRPFPYSINK